LCLSSPCWLSSTAPISKSHSASTTVLSHLWRSSSPRGLSQDRKHATSQSFSSL
jgi:hypothetical protein